MGDDDPVTWLERRIETPPREISHQLAEQNFYVDTPWTWRERLRFWAFPTQHCELPSVPAHYQDCVVVKTVVLLPFTGRIRVLFSGKLTVETKTVTEYCVGGTMTSSVAYPSL